MVSVIIPTYNRANVIETSVESVLNQTYTDIEVIIVDDGSDDNTKEIIDGINDTRIKYMRSSVNRGQSFARNVGIRRAKGEFIAFQDSDDVWLPDKLERQMKCFEDNPSCGLVYCMFEYQNSLDGKKIVYPPADVPLDVKTGWIFNNMFGGNLIDMPTIIIRKDILKTTGFLNEQIDCLEDFEWLLRVTKNYPVCMVEDILLHKYFSKDSVSKNKLKEAKTLCHVLINYHDDIVKADALEDMLFRIRECGKAIDEEETVEDMIKIALRYYE